MLGLTQDAINMITAMAVVHMVLFLGMMIATMLMRQIRRFGFTHSWGDGGKDINIDGF